MQQKPENSLDVCKIVINVQLNVSYNAVTAVCDILQTPQVTGQAALDDSAYCGSSQYRTGSPSTRLHREGVSTQSSEKKNIHIDYCHQCENHNIIFVDSFIQSAE